MERDQIRHDLSEQAWHWLAQAFAMPALLATPPRELSGITLPPSRFMAGEKFTA